MPTVVQVIQSRRERRLRQRRSPLGVLGLGFSLLAGLSLVGMIFTATLIVANVTRDLPSLEMLPVMLEPPNGALLQPTRLYDRSGTVLIASLQNPAADGSEYVHISREDGQGAPEWLAQATIASLDATFWDNPGYTLEGISLGTHPTLAQRLVMMLLVEDEAPSLQRNLRERLLASQVVRHFGREKVLEYFLNSAKYGERLYGADAAAHAYFGKPVVQLSLAEAAWLAAVAGAPDIRPYDAPQVAREGQERVIQQMLVQGMISGEQAQQALSQELSIRTPLPEDSLTAALTSLVIDQLSSQFPRDQIERGGLRITTTIDYALQVQTACATAVEQARLRGVSEGDAPAEGCEAARLLPSHAEDAPVYGNSLAASAAFLDPHTGQILALVGDPAGAYQFRRPAGTLLTPFIYLTAFTRGQSPASMLWDIPGGNGLAAAAPDMSGLASLGEGPFYHGPVRLRTALANDYLGPANQLLAQFGAENVWRIGFKFGFASLAGTPIDANALLELLSSDITLLEAVHAYGVFANQGILAGQRLQGSDPGNGAGLLLPVSVLRVEDSHGQVLLDNSTSTMLPVVSSQLAYLVTNVLSDETARWATLGHPNPLETGRSTGAKLGMSVAGQDAWAAGYTPQLVGAVWVGDSAAISQTIPTETAAGLWHALMQYAGKDLPYQEWQVPQGISTVEVCDPSGLLPTENCPAVTAEVFLNGNEPSHLDDLYRTYQINRDSGRLATVFTPPELVERGVFLAVPAQAVEWAESAGFPIPPSEYDVIYSDLPASADVTFSSPAMFAHVTGEVEFVGSAAGANFSYYRLQVGQGLNPSQWVQIGEDSRRPVRDGLLARWDTRGLQGLYVVRLLVVYRDQQVDSTIIQLTVDNQPPRAGILAPSAGETVAYVTGGRLTLLAEGSDDLVLNQMQFYVDDQLIASLAEPPYIAVWPLKLGEHTLRVRAIDLAGNTSEAVLVFTVQR